MAKIKKTDKRRIQDFSHRVKLLQDSIANFKRGDDAYYVQMLSTLRTLISDGDGNHLLRDMSSLTDVPVTI